MPIPEDQAVEAGLVDALAQTALRVTGTLTRIGAEHDLSLTQLRVLGILRDRRPRMAELAAYLGLDRSTMSGLVDRAERRGLLGRGKNVDDGRAIDVFLTPAGSALAERVFADVRADLLSSLGRLDRRQQVQLTRLLDQLIDPSEGAARPGSPSGLAGSPTS